tara:strand:- start:3064 stop:6756 length:3693 start_codon:yes stop_codon:yes gene_type:complete
MIDPTQIDTNVLGEQIDSAREYLEDITESREEQEVKQVEEEATEEKAEQVQADPRNADKWGLKAVAEEFKSVGVGGLQDTASSLMTFPERTADALTGEIARERKEKGFYRPEWDPLVDHDNPIITKTWWGKLLRGTVHFGSMAAAIIPAAKVTAARMGITGTGILANSLVRAAGVGAASDLISKESDAENALGMLRDRYGWIDTPLSTKDTDHPIMMKLKNIAEGIGIGLVFDSALMTLGKGSDVVKARIADRQKSVELQTLRKGIQELRRNEYGFRGSKNKPVADPHQAAHVSEDDPFVVWEQQKRIRHEWGAEDGSTGSVTTPIQRERVAREADISEEVVEDVLSKLYSKEKFRKTIEAVGNSRKRLVEVFGDSVAAHQRMTLGRNAADMTSGEYLKELFESYDIYDKGTPNQIQTITSKNVVAADLVVGSLIRQLRDLGIAGREIADFADLGDIDGPADQIVDTMLTALTEVKKARIVKSQNFRELGAGKRRYLEETLSKDMADTRESIMSILKIAKDEPDEDMLNALFEAFSSMKTVNSVDDFDHWARKMIKGGDIEGKKQTGAFIRELEGVMIHSILSGPKTPARAIMGTATATFLRPLSTTFGAMLSTPFTGDTATVRAGLSSINAMIEAIPESWTLFRNKLDSYWSGDISTVKTRFAEYTRGDDNWELLRKWVESPDSGATTGDRVWFNLANMARSLNNKSFLTYSTKIMAATDDAFAYILGRTKMREKAMRSALDAKAKGKLTAYNEITPELVRIYEEDFYRQIFDGNGNIVDEATKFARKEVTLTNELKGFAQGLNSVFQAHPWAKPFFLFARTGVNGLQLTAKHTPGFNFLVKEWNDIAFAGYKDIDNLRQYGITSAVELDNAKALQVGRLAMGSSLVFMASQAWMRGDLTGNGPVDRQKRQVWMDAGYKPRTLKLGGVRIGYDSIEPFNQVMSMIADIGDASQLMGEEWTEKQLLKVGLLLAQGVTSKSYLAGMQQFVDLFGGRPGQAERIVANIANNQVPLAGLRNELGKLFTPYTRELGSGIDQSIRNRNLLTEKIAGEPLPIKYDILTGKPLKEWDPLTRFFNAFSPVNFSLDQSPGRKLLFESGYDLRVSTFFSPFGDDLTDSPEIRSMYQKAIGQQNLERKLDKLAENEKVLESIETMHADIRAGNRGEYEGKDYFHNMKIDNIMDEARRKAWAKIMNDTNVQSLVEEQKQKKIKRMKKTKETQQIQPIISIYK